MIMARKKQPDAPAPRSAVDENVRVAIWGMNRMIEAMQARRDAPHRQRLDMVMACIFHYLKVAAPLWSKESYRSGANDN